MSVPGTDPDDLDRLPGTTGLPAIHYRISDGISDPAGNEANYTESCCARR